MVPLGLHWPINAIMLVNIQTLGYDFIQGPMGAWNFACFGATAGVLFPRLARARQNYAADRDRRPAAGLAAASPNRRCNGIHLRFKRIYPRMLVGRLVGGLIIGRRRHHQGVRVHSLLTIPAFSSMGLWRAIAVLAAFFTAMILVIVSGYRTWQGRRGQAAAGVRPVADLESPMGEARQTPHQAAATKAVGDAGLRPVIVPTSTAGVVALERRSGSGVRQVRHGPGVAIEPSGDTAYAPGSGVVVAAQPIGHVSFGWRWTTGWEVLIHTWHRHRETQGEASRSTQPREPLTASPPALR